MHIVGRRFGWLAAGAVVAALAGAGCTNRVGQGDPPSEAPGGPLGSGLRLRDVQDPANANAGKFLDATGVTVLAVDGFDETGDGKSRGTIFVQDYASTEPLSGVSIYSAVLVPSNLRLSPGDVVDLHGQYVELSAIGSNHFSPGAFLPQFATPTTTFRFEGGPLTPREIDLDDLAKFETGRRWISMLVTVKDVYATTGVVADPASGRATVTLAKSMPGTGSASEPTMSNELAQLDAKAITHDDTGAIQGKKMSVTGIVTFFGTARAVNFHIAPRSMADVVLSH